MGQNLKIHFFLLFFSYVIIRIYRKMLFRVDILPGTSDYFFFFLLFIFAESFVVEQQALFGVDFIHISMISVVKVQC